VQVRIWVYGDDGRGRGVVYVQVRIWVLGDNGRGRGGVYVQVRRWVYIAVMEWYIAHM